METLRWGILSTGRIAGAFAEAVNPSTTGELAAVGSRSGDSAHRFAESYGIPRSHSTYAALLADPNVDAVYIATPHPFHAEWATKAAEAGKHILCEKPLTLNHAEATKVIEAARANDVFLMEAFMYRCHPQTAKLVELIREKAVGDVRMIQAAFSFRAPFDADSRMYSNELGGGGILDVGCYCVSMARLLAGAALGWEKSADPEQVTGTGVLNEQTGTDEVAVAALRFEGGILASLSAGVGVMQENRLVVYGTEGRIVVPEAWIPGRNGQATSMEIHRSGGEVETLQIQADVGLYTLEADTVARHIADREAPWPAMSWDDSLGNMRTLDRWREAIGLTYNSERS